MIGPWRAVWRRKLPIAQPTPWWEGILRFGAMVLVNPWTRKDAQGWHYKVYTDPILFPVHILGDPDVGDRSKGVIANFKNSDIAARNIVLFRPAEEGVAWHLGFSAYEGGKQVTQLCAAILHGVAGATRQGYDTDFFGVEEESGRSLKLILVGETTKSELGDDIPLL